MEERRRRRRGTGSIHQRASDGMWLGTADLGYTSHGTRRRYTVYAHTREEAEQRLAAVLDGKIDVPQVRRRPPIPCSRCGQRVPREDTRLGMCGACYPWGHTTAAGVTHPHRGADWSRFTCRGCGIRLWTRSGATTCVACQSSPTAQWRVRTARVTAARAIGTHTDAEWLGLLEAFGNACAYCGRADRRLTKDHVVPVARGGSELIENIAPACKSCNARKNDLTLREFAAVRHAI